MRATHELEQESIRVAQSVTEPLLGHPVHAKIETTDMDFHSGLLRNVHAARLTLWKPLTPLDVLVDGEGRVVGYVDWEARQGAAPGGDAVQDYAFVAELVADEELLPPRAEVLSVQPRPTEDGGEVLHVLVAAPGGDPRQWVLELNPVRRLVAAMRPVDGSEGAQ